MPDLDPLTVGLLVVAALAIGIATGALVLAAVLRTRVYALEQLQGLTTRRIRVIAEHAGVPLAVERRSGKKLPSGMEDRRRPLTDGPVPEGSGRPRGSTMASSDQMDYYRRLGALARPQPQVPVPTPPPPLPPLRAERDTDELPRSSR